MNISDRLDQEADHIVATYSQHCLQRAVDRQADDWLLVRSGLATLAERIKDDAAAEIERLRGQRDELQDKASRGYSRCPQCARPVLMTGCPSPCGTCRCGYTVLESEYDPIDPVDYIERLRRIVNDLLMTSDDVALARREITDEAATVEPPGTSTLPERLRALADHITCWDHPITAKQDCIDAAREIERLRAQRDESQVELDRRDIEMQLLRDKVADKDATIERLRDLIRRAESICGPGLEESPLEDAGELLREMQQIRDEDAAAAEAYWQTIPAADLPPADMASIADPVREAAEAATGGDR